DVDVLLEGRVHDHLGRLAETGVDDLEALVPEAAREALGRACVAVQAGLRDQDLDRAVGHGPDCATRRLPPDLARGMIRRWRWMQPPARAQSSAAARARQ